MSQMRRLLEAVDSMSKASKKSTGPKFPGYWEGDMPASKARDKMVGGCEENVIKELAKEAKSKRIEWRLAEAYKNFVLDEYGNAQNPNAQTTTPGANGSAQADDDNDAQSKTTDAAMQKNVNLLKTLDPKLNTQLATQAMAKTDIPGAPMTGTDINQSKQLVGLLEPALSDPQIGSQVTTLLRKAGQAEKNKRV